MSSPLPQLKHVGIYVNDLENLRGFYQRVFGLAETDRGHSARYGNAQICFLSSSPGVHHQLVLMEWPKGAAKGPSNVNQLSFAVNSLGELRIIHQRLQDEAVRDLRPINHVTALSVYALDPEGNGLEVYLDLPWYIAQPHGETLDLSLSDEEILRQTEMTARRSSSFQTFDAWSGKFESRLNPGRPEPGHTSNA